MGWYKEGKVNVVAGQTNVTGVGTNFAANTLTGDAFIGPDGQWYEVINAPSPTTLSISPAYRSATVSNANYALMPVQGYQRDLAIAAGAIIQQWGSTLAGLGTVSTENVVPVAKGGTGGTTAALARSALGLKSAAVADIVGLIADGAIMEAGSNAIGEYWRFANGLLINKAKLTSASIAANTTSLVSGTYPYQFLPGSQPSPVGMVRAGASIDHYGIIGGSQSDGGSHSSVVFFVRNGGTAQTFQIWYISIGVWK